MRHPRDRPLLRRVLLSAQLLPDRIEGVGLRLLYFLFVYVNVTMVLTLVAFGAPSRLALAGLPAVGAPDWLATLIGGALLFAGLAWLLAAFLAGVRWVADGRTSLRSGERKREKLGIALAPGFILKYLRDLPRQTEETMSQYSTSRTAEDRDGRHGERRSDERSAR